MRGEALGRVERWRRWSAAEKLTVVMASLEPGAVVATVARRFDVTRQQVYDWRRDWPRGGDHGDAGAWRCDGGRGCAARESARERDDAVGAVTAPTVTVEVVLVGGRVLCARAALPTAELRRLISAVEGA